MSTLSLFLSCLQFHVQTLTQHSTYDFLCQKSDIENLEYSYSKKTNSSHKNLIENLEHNYSEIYQQNSQKYLTALMRAFLKFLSDDQNVFTSFRC